MLESAPTIPLAASLRIAIGIFSYDGNVHFGITGDYDTAADIDVLRGGIERGIVELVATTQAPATPVNGEAAPPPSPAPTAPKRRRPASTTTA
jgi:diacylglycerol O-acyltransferase